MTDPFALFGAEARFGIDLEKFGRARERALARVHPDRFADRPAAERRVAEQWTARINEAWDTLRDPVRRASWFCAQNHEARRTGSRSVSHASLMRAVHCSATRRSAAGRSAKRSG